MFVLEEDAVSETVSELYDIAVIGGGINGVGIAADAAGRAFLKGLIILYVNSNIFYNTIKPPIWG